MCTGDVINNLSSAQLDELVFHVGKLEELGKIGTHTIGTRELWDAWAFSIDLSMLKCAAFSLIREREKAAERQE